MFVGFLPAKSSARRAVIKELATVTAALVIYEAPHRVLDTLGAMQEVFGSERKACMARELTKQFETICAGTLIELVSFVASDTNQQRGEIVLIIAGAEITNDKFQLTAEAQRTLDILLTELTVKQAVSLAVKITGVQKKILYDYAIGRL